MVFLSLGASLYSYLKPGISSPAYPDEKIKESLNLINSTKLISMTVKSLNQDSSDRKASKLYTYLYADGSELLGTLVRVRKKDDFKIETYGLLTKNLSPIYIKSGIFVNSIPYSTVGSIGNRRAIQTCVIPGTNKLNENDIRLSELTAAVERLYPSSKTIFTKLLGTEQIIDYSCLVLTYKPSLRSPEINQKNWLSIVKNVQAAMATK